VDDVTRALVLTSASVATGDAELLDIALAGAMHHAPAAQVEEALLQSYLFVGYPAALQALARWRELGGGGAAGAPDHDGGGGGGTGGAPDQDGWDGWRARGLQTFATVYGEQAGPLRANVEALHADLAEWMIVEGYGKVLSRPGLPLAVRELCIVALLAAQDAPRQLYSHLRGALRAGAAAEDVDATLRAVSAVIGPERSRAAFSEWDRVRERTGTLRMEEG
jgi:4-carboxymuconolactone decarboxylase